MADLRIALEISGAAGNTTGVIDGVVRSLNSLERAAGSAHTPTTNVFRTLATGLVQGAGQAVAGRVLDQISGGFDAVKDAAIGLNSKLEQSKIGFTTMLGSGEKAQAFLDKLSKFAAQTPFQFPDLVQASSRMLAFGFAAEDVVPILTSVGNAAAAMGSGKEGIDTITRALGQMQAKTKVQAEEMLQLTEAGIPAWDMLAKKLGVDVASAMDKVSKGTVKASTFLEAFQEGVKTRFGDQMALQARTFEGAMSTIQDSLQMAVARGFKPLFDAMSAGMQQRAAFLSGNEINEWADHFADALRQGLTLVAQFQTGMEHLLTTVSTVASEVGRQFALVFSPILDTAASLFGVSGQGGSLGTQISAFVAGLPARIAGLPDAIAAALQTLPTVTGGVLNDLATFWNTHIDQINATANTIVTTVRGVWAAVQTATQVALTQVVPFILAQLGAAVTWVVDNWPLIQTTVGNVFEGVRQTVTTVVGTVVPFLQSMLGAAVSWVQEHWPLIQTTVTNVLTTVQGTVTTVLETVVPFVQTMLGAAVSWVQANWPLIQTTVTNVFSAVQATISNILGTVVPFVQTMFGAAVAWVQTNWPLISSTVETVFTALQATVTNVLNTAVPFIQTMFGAAVSWVQDNWPTIQTTITDALNTVWGTIQTVLGVAVPFVQERFGALKTWVETNWPLIQQTIGTAWQGIQDTAQRMAGGVQRIALEAFGAVKGWVDQNWPVVQSTLTTGWTALQTKAAEVWPQIQRVAVDAFRDIQREMQPTSITSTNLREVWRVLGDEVGPRLGGMLRDFLRDLSPLNTALTTANTQAGGLSGGLQSFTGQLRDLVSGLPRALDFLVLFGNVLSDLQAGLNSIGLAINRTARGQFQEAQQYGQNAITAFTNMQTRMGNFFNQPGAGGGAGGGTPISEGGGGVNFGAPPFGTPVSPVTPPSQPPGLPRVTVPPELQPGGGGTDYRAIARAAATGHGVDADIFERQINQESGFNPNAVSPAGARGLAQFMPATGAGVAAQLGIPLDRFWADPTLQLEGAAVHMHDLLAMFGGNYRFALAGYNAGPGAVQQYGGVPPYEETQRYVRSILGYAMGGLIAEPVMGLGLHSGRGYMFGETGSERVLSNAQTRDYDSNRRGVTVQQTIHHYGTSAAELEMQMSRYLRRAVTQAGRV